MRKLLAVLTAAAALSGCGTGGGSGNGTAGSGNAAGAVGNSGAEAGTGAGGQPQALRAGDGAERGTVTVSDAGGGLQVRVAATGLPPGTHGAHLHAVGRCDAPDFASAGPHWNPANKQHGTENPAGPHLGDMPNLTVAADGTGTLEFTVPGASMQGGQQALADADGAAFVIHADADDYRTDPSGNSGGRIACAVLAPAR